MNFISSLLCLVALTSFSLFKKKGFVPPGTVKITEKFYADECEVTNFSWEEYTYWLRVKYGLRSMEYLSALPDTLVWRDKERYNEPYVRFYYRNPAFREYPVVGVSYEQAVEFCKWRTERVKSFYYLKYKKEIHLEYRLPNKQEWEMLAAMAQDLVGLESKNNEKMPKLFNYRPKHDTSFTFTYANITKPVRLYEKNYYGLYNMLGNVAEMVSEKNISKGGSWMHLSEQCRYGKDISYIKPQAWLGFRCVCVIK